jgi:hypothetical protein
MKGLAMETPLTGKAMRTRNILLIFAAVSLFSCNKEKESQPSKPDMARITAEIENSDTKTELLLGSGISQVLWSEGDAIAVLIDENDIPARFVLAEGEGDTRAVFTCSDQDYGENYVAYYPADYFVDKRYIPNSESGGQVSWTGEITVELPLCQEYKQGSFGNGALPMVATSSSTVFSFKNLASVLRIPVKGHTQLDSLVFRPIDKDMLVSGKAVVSSKDVSLSMIGGMGKNRVLLLTPGLTLSEGAESDLYVILPPGTYKGGFSVSFYSGASHVEKSYYQDFTFGRSQLHTTGLVHLELDEVKESESLEGAGTSDNPFKIKTLGDFLLLRTAVNTGGKIKTAEKDVAAATASYTLESDLDLSRLCNEQASYSWTPIGSESNPFLGSFDGKGHSLSNFYLAVGTEMYNGLWAYVGTFATIKNLVVEGRIIRTVFDNFYGPDLNAFTGMIAGHIDINSSIENCSVKGRVEGDWRYTGGLVGENYGGNIRKCVNYATVVGAYEAGGIAGITYMGLSDCINYGEIRGQRAGGMASTGGGHTVNCFNYGSVVADADDGGGIYGFYDRGDIINCVNVAEVTSAYSRSAAGIVGFMCGSGRIINCLNTGSITGICSTEWDYAAGICGSLPNWNINPFTPPAVYNSVNLGQVKVYSSSGGLDHLAGVVGRSSETVQQNYWLYDPENGLGVECGIASDEGESANNYPVTLLQLKGEDTGIMLYRGESTLLGALNDWAGSHLNSFASPLFGWKYDENGDLAFTGVAADPTEPETEPDYYISTDFSHDGEIVNLQAASEGEGIELVLLGDAFSDRQIADGTYADAMQRLMDSFFGEEPYASYRHLFNVNAITVVSSTEGYQHDGQALSTWFGDGSSVGGDDFKCMAYALNVVPENKMDKTVIVVAMNMDYYAGTCYMYNPLDGDYGNGLSIAYFPTSSDVTTFDGLVSHEAGGHGFAKLADEYDYPGTISEEEVDYHKKIGQFGWWKNVDFTDEPSMVKWAKFITDDRYASEGIGVYEGACTYQYGAWRPTEQSIMRHNIGGFNAPSREAIYYRIHKLAYGDDWQYNYEDFVAWDLAHRAPASTKARSARPNFVEKEFQPLAPPVVINKDWREVVGRSRK